jgi:TPR repeat protein
MGHIFVSYSRQDQDLVDKIVRVLAKAGAKVWIDREGIAGGLKWRRQIVEAIDAADAVLLALSPNAVKSDNVRKELDLGEEFKKTIFPVEMERTPIPKDLSYQLVGLQRIDLVTDFNAGARLLLNALGLPTESSPQTEGIGEVQPTAATPESQYQRGQKLYSAGQYALALQCFRDAAERGHAASQNALGVWYFYGEGGGLKTIPKRLSGFAARLSEGSRGLIIISERYMTWAAME